MYLFQVGTRFLLGLRSGDIHNRHSYLRERPVDNIARPRKGRLEIETDTGDRIAKNQQKTFLATWHLELSAGQYRKARNGQPAPRGTRLVKNIVLSMPS